MNLISRIRDLSTELEPIPTGLEPVLKPLDVDAVLFDVYGTLFISGSGDVGVAQAQANASALRGALTACGFSGDLESVAAAGFNDWVTRIWAEHAEMREHGADVPEVEVRDMWPDVLAAWQADGRLQPGTPPVSTEQWAVEFEFRANPVWPMPGVREVLAAVVDLGLPMGIVSNAQFFTPLMFDALLDASVETLGFDADYCAWSYELERAKPSPTMFAGVLEALDRDHIIPPQRVLYVGNDMLNDIYTATQAGCRTALFAGDKRSLRLRETDTPCKALTPDVTLTDLSQLPDCLA